MGIETRPMILLLEEAPAGNLFAFVEVLFDPDLALGLRAFVEAAPEFVPVGLQQGSSSMPLLAASST